ncbi:LCYD1-like protein [Mya arenaria]|uniref:LCYD1-like protein n=1 Tax=Mya arenaria TaxID=6604 RepID=A0ABY7G9F9_MYAAR|nr:uncharacterized protein LOC128224566 [Mya arenaria]WAR31068.1 LCYD1-like protein [Mya arenaria]
MTTKDKLDDECLNLQSAKMEQPVPDFGPDIRKEFMLKERSVFLNHGSYGGMPKCVHDRQVKYLIELEENPDGWFRNKMYKYLNSTIAVVAEFMGVKKEDTFMIQNITKAANTVLKTFPLKSGDGVLVNTLTYGAVNVATRVTTKAVEGAQTYSFNIDFPIMSEDEIVAKYDEILEKHPEVKLVMVDHIASPTAIVMPVKKIVEVCHKHGKVVFVDAAHIPGQIEADIVDMDADFYAGNLHKWVFCPRSSAFIWRNPNRPHAWFKPLITSHFEHFGIHEAFAFEGTKDDIPYLCAVDGINFLRRLGGVERIRSYCIPLLKEGMAYLEEKWGTKRLNIPENMRAPFQCVIEVPFIRGFSDIDDKPSVTGIFRGRHYELQNLIFDDYDVQVKVLYINKRCMIRVSVAVYSSMGDFEKLAEAVLDLARKRNEGK